MIVQRFILRRNKYTARPAAGAAEALRQDLLSIGPRITIHVLVRTRHQETLMSESTITAKGQTTVPQQIREALDAGPGTRLLWYVLPDGSISVRVKSKSILDLAGMLKAPKGRRVSVDKMNPWR